MPLDSDVSECVLYTSLVDDMSERSVRVWGLLGRELVDLDRGGRPENRNQYRIMLCLSIQNYKCLAFQNLLEAAGHQFQTSNIEEQSQDLG